MQRALQRSWLDGVRTIGITAGASAPPHLVTAVVDHLARLGPAAAPDRPVIIVLNDNGRSYDPTAGGLATHLTALRGRRPWQSESAPADDTREVEQSTVFEQLGLAYLGPVDGHDIGELEHALRHAACLNRPVVVHAVTEKGRGWRPAETDTADRMHGIGILDPATGAAPGPSTPSWTSVFAEEMVRISHDRDDVVAITAAMRIPVGLHKFGKAFPCRLFDVGIAESLGTGSTCSTTAPSPDRRPGRTAHAGRRRTEPGPSPTRSADTRPRTARPCLRPPSPGVPQCRVWRVPVPPR